MPTSTLASQPPVRPRGRPRGFDMDEVLDKAVRVFRTHGYHAASISVLTQATGLTEGSLYKAFPGKEALFVAAFARYCGERQRALAAVLAAHDDGAAQLRAALRFYVASSVGPEGRLGCLIVGSTAVLDLLDADVGATIRQALRRNEATLVALIEKGIADGSIRDGVDAVATAKLLWCMLLGIRVAGKAGADPEELDLAVEQAMRLLG